MLGFSACNKYLKPAPAVVKRRGCFFYQVDIWKGDMAMTSVKIEVNVTVHNVADADDIGDDLHEILNKCGITNSVVVTDEISE